MGAAPQHRLTPQARKVVDGIARARQVPLYQLSAEQAKAAYEAAANVLELPVQALARVEDFSITVRDGHTLRARHYAPREGPLPVLLFFHGGGFVVGSLATHDGVCRRLAHGSGCAVVSVDYRLAPAHRFPVAHNDAWDAVQWLVQQGAQRQLDSSRMAVGGDSAGGTLAAACAIEARNRGVPLALQVLFYPGCEGHQASPSHRTYAHGFVLDARTIDFFFQQYLRTPEDRDDWRFAPLDGKGPDGWVADLSGVAPAWIALAECDPLCDEGLGYADRLRMAGVDVDLELYRGMVHEFIKMGRAIPQAMQAHQDAAQALRRALRPSEP